MTRSTLTASVVATAFSLTLGAAVQASDPGVSADSILLGQSCALKGPASALGNGMKLGLEVYFDKINSQGGVNGRTIALKSINDGYNPKKCVVATKMLIEKLNVFALIGEVGTPTSKVAVPIAEEHNVPFIAPFTGAEFLRHPYKPMVRNLRGSYYQEMERLAQFLVDQKGFRKIACFYQNDAYGKAGLTGIERALDRRGLKLVSTGTYERNTTAVAQGMKDVAQGDPDAVVMVGAYKPCAAFIKVAKNDPTLKDAVFCNISFVGTKALAEELGSAGEGCVISQVVPYPWDPSVPVVAEYIDAMKAAGHENEIGFITLEGYLAGKLFAKALEAVEGEPTRQKFLDAFAKLGEIDLGGIVVRYGPEDNQGMDDVFLTVLKGGKAVPLTDGGLVDVP